MPGFWGWVQWNHPNCRHRQSFRRMISPDKEKNGTHSRCIPINPPGSTPIPFPDDLQGSGLPGWKAIRPSWSNSWIPDHRTLIFRCGWVSRWIPCCPKERPQHHYQHCSWKWIPAPVRYHTRFACYAKDTESNFRSVKKPDAGNFCISC